ncbi:hypothetical protein GCM10010393_14960 [Streptomyces gobitricini]|uniref:Transposase n=1 Tax=Streptomyces gobitricini TaxID=68211 RepID=A0ABP5YQ76_9ACTN
MHARQSRSGTAAEWWGRKYTGSPHWPPGRAARGAVSSTAVPAARRKRRQTPSEDRPGEEAVPPGYRKTPDWKVVPGQATAIPAIPASQAEPRNKKAGRAVSRQMVL